MNIHTLCLSIILILFTINPVSLIGTIVNFPGVNKGKNYNLFFLKLLSYLLIVQVVFIYLLDKNIFYINFKIEYFWYIIALVMVPINIGIEILVGILLIKLKGKKIGKISFKSKGVINTKNIYIFTLTIGLCEELIFRQTWFNLLKGNMNIYIIVLVSGIAYGFNHIFIGNKVILQKILIGFIYGLLYVFSGSIIIPIITHCVENIVVIKRGLKYEN